MAQRRMFSDKIVDTDSFLDMGIGSQLLYFHLCMRADDDGFVSNPKKIMRMVGSQEDDYKVLIAKRFVIQFESGVCVIKHWLIHNLIRGDRYSETQWVKEKSQLAIDPETKKYSLNKGDVVDVIPDGNQMAPQVRLGKVRLGKDSVVENTPAKTNQDFFAQGKVYTDLLATYSQKVEPSLAETEFKKFTLYWTEPNKSGSKVRWEQQPTFDVERRLYTWFSRVNDRRKTTSSGRGIA